ncbi:hypothetical protein GL58_10375 [Comamonas testosteroni]|uniref:Uncharacterized protein n=1 Tax=Comamonas testosteroni TaxID=285 RepID=A0A0L7MGS9_COMTE|nr:hypothetical protein GL58_10375 [Comamonas testosteroni]
MMFWVIKVVSTDRASMHLPEHHLRSLSNYSRKHHPESIKAITYKKPHSRIFFKLMPSRLFAVKNLMVPTSRLAVRSVSRLILSRPETAPSTIGVSQMGGPLRME